MKAPISAAGISSAAGIGLAMLMPVVSPSSSQVACSKRGQRGRAVEPARRGQAAGAAVERRELVAAVDDHGHAKRLQPFEREADVEDALDARRDDGHRGDGQFGEIGGDVEGGGRAAVHAADAAGGEHADAGQRGDAHRGGDRGGPGGAGGDQPRQIAGGGLVHALLGGQPFELFGGRGRRSTRRRAPRWWRAWRRWLRTMPSTSMAICTFCG